MRGGRLVDDERPFDGGSPRGKFGTGVRVNWCAGGRFPTRRRSRPGRETPRPGRQKCAGGRSAGTRRRRSGHLSGTLFHLISKMKRTGLRWRLSRTAVALLTVILASMIKAAKSGNEPSANCRTGRRFSAAILFSWSSSLSA